MSSARSIYRLFAFLAAACFVFLGAGCRHDVVNRDGETVSAVITPLHIGRSLLPFNEKNVTTYGLSTGPETEDIDSYGLSMGIVTKDIDSCGIFASMGSEFTGTNFGASASLVFGIHGRESSFNGISAGLFYIGAFGKPVGTQNGISIFPFAFGSGTNGLSVEASTLSKEFNGIDICLFNLHETRGAGLQVIGLDCSAKNESRITGCQIGGLLRSSVRGAQIGAITYNPGRQGLHSDSAVLRDGTGIDRGHDYRKSLGKCLNLGVLNFDLKEGFQIGAVNNTSDGNPVQIGLFNTTFDGSPFQIGLLNINPNGFLPVFPFFNYSVKKGAFERERESAVGF